MVALTQYRPTFGMPVRATVELNVADEAVNVIDEGNRGAVVAAEVADATVETINVTEMELLGNASTEI